MTRQPIDLYVLDTLANDIEGFEDVLRLINHPDLGWQGPYGGVIRRDALLLALRRVVGDGLVQVLSLGASMPSLEKVTDNKWPDEADPAELWFKLTPSGRLLHANWEP